MHCTVRYVCHSDLGSEKAMCKTVGKLAVWVEKAKRKDETEMKTGQLDIEHDKNAKKIFNSSEGDKDDLSKA
jgi:hypothetical protein